MKLSKTNLGASLRQVKEIMEAPRHQHLGDYEFVASLCPDVKEIRAVLGRTETILEIANPALGSLRTTNLTGKLTQNAEDCWRNFFIALNEVFFFNRGTLYIERGENYSSFELLIADLEPSDPNFARQTLSTEMAGIARYMTELQGPTPAKALRNRIMEEEDTRDSILGIMGKSPY